MLELYFQQLGFSPNEITIYLALAELGKSTASLIAKKTQLARSTTYSVLEALLKRGLLSIEQDQGVSYYIANQPSALQRMLDKEREEYESGMALRSAAAQELLPLIGPFFKSENYSVPRLQFFEGTANVENMLYDFCRDWQQSVARYDCAWWGYQDHHLVEQYRTWLEYYWNSMLPKEQVCLLSNRSEVERELDGQVAKRHIRLVPEGYEFSSTIWVVGDYVITIMTHQKPHYAFQLKDAVFAANQRKIFQLLWKLSS